MTDIDGGTALSLAAALGAGLLVGLERERRKRGRAGAARAQAAGIRSFALVGFAGGLAETLGRTLATPWLVLAGAVLVGALSVVAYARSLRVPVSDGADIDPGITTELALFVVYLVGVLSAQSPPLGAAAAVGVAVLLASRQRLHHLATQALSEAELHDALLLAALALILLPLMPAVPVPAWQAWVPVAPRTLLLTVVLILALQAAGHVSGRLFGARAGLALAGLFSGFVSSTATIVAMGSRVRQAQTPQEAAAATAGALASTVATWLQAMLLVTVLAPSALPSVAPAAMAGAAAAGAAAFIAWRRLPAPAGGPPRDRPGHGPLRLREAVVVATLLTAVTAGVAVAQRHFGALGVYGGTVLAALADAHAPIAALASLHAQGGLPATLLVQGVLMAVGTNACTRGLAAWTAGGRRFAGVVGGSLLLSTGAAALVALAMETP